MKVKVIDIKWDTDGEDIDLPTEIEVEVPNNLHDEEVSDYISDKISDEVGFCHFGFNFSLNNLENNK